MSGVDLNTIRELMRHKDFKTTLRYAHLSRDHKARALDVFAGQMDTIWTPKAKEQNIDHSRLIPNPIEEGKLQQFWPR